MCTLNCTFKYLLGEEASPSIGNTLWRVSTMFTRPAITPPEVYGFGWNLGTLSILSGAGPDRFWARFAQKRERESELKFFCEVNNARLCRFPVSQILRNLHTRRGSKRWQILSEKHFKNLPVRGLISKKATFGRPSSTTSDFRPRYLRNDYKSRKVMTGCQPMECWLSVCTLGINLKSFPWPAGCVQETTFLDIGGSSV